MDRDRLPGTGDGGDRDGLQYSSSRPGDPAPARPVRRAYVQPRPLPIGHAVSVPAVARITEREHVRTIRMQRHFITALLTGLLSIFIAPDVSTTPGFTLICLLVYVALHSLARGADAGLGYLWGWLYREPERTTRLDRVVERLVRGPGTKEDDEPSRIRFL